MIGRVNLIDVGALLVAIALVFGSVAAARALRGRPVQITAVTPHRLTIGSPMRVRVKGAPFRPSMDVWVGVTGELFRLDEAERVTQKATVSTTSPSAIDLELSDLLPPGTYDLHVTERGHVVATARAAVVVSHPEYPHGVNTVKVRFYPPAESAPLIRVGDRDIVVPRTPLKLVAPPAVVTSVDDLHQRKEVVDMRLTPDRDIWVGQPTLGELVEVTLRVPELETAPGIWYYCDQGIVVGRVFTLTTDRYQLHGIVSWVGPVERGAWPVDSPP